MIASVLFLLVPAALADALLSRTRLFASRTARAFTAWFVGECAATFAVYGIAVVLAPRTEGVLRKAALLVLGAAAGALLALVLRSWRSWRSGRDPGRSVVDFLLPQAETRRSPTFLAGRLAFFAAAAVFSVAFYRPHLAQSPDAIVRSPVYWDFNVHAPIVQTFVFGDNFPPKNESFAGVPETYHFFFDLFTAIPVSFGVGLADAFQLVSATTLFALLGSMAGFTEELAGAALPGMIAALLACTSSSLHVFTEWFSDGGSFLSPFRAALDARHPYVFSFVKGSPFAYNGTMFNLFYYLEERQLVFASGFLLAAALLLATRGTWRTSACFGAGAFFGLFVFWHLFVTVSLGLAVVWLLAFAPDRRKTAAILAGMALVGAAFLLWVRGVSRPEWFVAGGRPALRINPGFSTMPGGPPFSLPQALGYWTYAWGLKIVLGVAGLASAYRSRRRFFHALASVLAPTFLLVNTLQVVPLSVYDNHKWSKPMDLFLDLAAGWFLADGILRARLPRLVRVSAAAAAVVLVTLSGVIELVPFLRSRATVLYAQYPAPFTDAVRARTAPRSTFVSFESNALHMAGRKLFVGNDADERGTASLVASAGFDVGRRHRAVVDLYAAPTRARFCRAAAANAIDWVEVEPDVRRASGADARAPGFDAVTPGGRAIRFLDVRGYCGGPSAVSAPSREDSSTPRAAPS